MTPEVWCERGHWLLETRTVGGGKEASELWRGGHWVVERTRGGRPEPREGHDLQYQCIVMVVEDCLTLSPAAT